LLVGLLDQAIDVLSDHENLKTEILHKKLAKKAIDSVDSVIGDLDRVLQFAAGAGTFFQDFQLDISSEQYETLEELLHELLAYIDDDDLALQDSQILIQAANKSAQFSSMVKSQWEMFMSQYGQEVLQVLDVIAPLLTDQTRAKGVQTIIRNASVKWIPSKTDLKNLAEAVAEGREIVDELQVDEKIRDFLVMITKSQATLDILDDEVLQWIRAHELESRLIIKFSGAA
jgi:hypothetical protein